ncbi:ubiquitin conjugating enzyme-like protein [Trichodelitschia bisporula]|uniref:Ubiquitin conjugating enzyme-like protein n=1 Tax=Trichodelitschia bisporula TaxID=703511 RepID=A0A6G1HPY6_9PEZI|nr:ubiquitin conjugating enzyme-like protein [Trichodelitschia bisporula]
MSTPKFNTKSPTIKRILKEASELATHPSPDFSASPTEANLHEWHFTLRGPPSSPYTGGLYHGRIVLPSTYPLRPPSFRFLTPSGRFEPNREICLSISGHHEESWQPAWGVRTALTALRAFMSEEPNGQIGGLNVGKVARERLAKESGMWTCAACGKSNADIMAEHDELVQQLDPQGKDKDRHDEQPPPELRLAFRDELKPSSLTSQAPVERAAETPTSTGSDALPAPDIGQVQVRAPTETQVTVPIRQPVGVQTRRRAAGEEAWLDKYIYAVAGILAWLVARKVLGFI